MSRESILNTLINLDKQYGVSGDEERVAETLKKEMEGLFDEHVEDVFGNQMFIRYGKNSDKTIMFAAHMDEIGFIISYVEENGFCRFLPVGHHDDRNVVNQDMVIMTDEGQPVRGVTGAKPAHMLTAGEGDKVTPMSQLFVDLGTSSREETKALGVDIGSYMAYGRQGYMMNEGRYFTGRAVDDRAGLAVLVEALRLLKDCEPDWNVIMAGTCQEEVGLRGGGMITDRFKPDVFIAVDVSFTGDTPGMCEADCPVFMGKGPTVMIYDWDSKTMTGNNVPKKLIRQIIDVADRHNIPYQKEVSIGGGTDAASASLANCGTMAGGIGIPERYMHTAVGTADIDDMLNAALLIEKLVKEIDL